jgi:hypothetical protein
MKYRLQYVQIYGIIYLPTNENVFKIKKEDNHEKIV